MAQARPVAGRPGCGPQVVVHTALVLRAPNGSPNSGPELALARSIHQDLPGFADYWLSR